MFNNNNSNDQHRLRRDRLNSSVPCYLHYLALYTLLVGFLCVDPASAVLDVPSRGGIRLGALVKSGELKETRGQTVSEDASSKITPPPTGHRYLVFYGSGAGQGAGNIMQGLLAAQLLGLEFNRTVCVVWPNFLEAFEYTQLDQQSALCAGADKWETSYTFQIWNFISGEVDECKMAGILSSKENTVVGYRGNTYPGWRSEVPSNFFHQYYRPKAELLRSLPYQSDEPPQVVVHLRSPDPSEDNDRGLNEESLTALGKMLSPSSKVSEEEVPKSNGTTYLVTNRADWYLRFEDCCGWSYDTTWVNKPIDHGALELSWRPDGTTTNKNNEKKEQNPRGASSQNMKLWVDWYTILNARVVYHSSSDFSRSAIHWNSQIISAFELHGTVQNRRKRQARLRWSPSSTAAAATSTVPELDLRSTYEYSQRIPPLIERLEPNAFLPDDSCTYKRFCTKYRTPKDNN